MKLTGIFIVLMLLSGCSNDFQDSHKEMPADFDFSLKYGVHGKREINTFNNFVVKDLVSDGTVQASLTLTEQEMNDIYNEMMKINIIGELELNKEKGCNGKPSSYSIWEIHMNNETKKYNYQGNCETSKDILKLYKLEDFIHEIIIQRDEYKKLPAAVNGGYK